MRLPREGVGIEANASAIGDDDGWQHWAPIGTQPAGAGGLGVQAHAGTATKGCAPPAGGEAHRGVKAAIGVAD